MSNTESIFPTTEQANKIIYSLEKLEWNEFDGNNIEEYTKQMNSKLMGPSGLFYGSVFDSDKLNTIFPTVYRVRKVDEVKNKFLRSQYSYPPVEFTTKNLRANLINHPVFYGADHPGTALVEFLSQWNKEVDYSTEYMISCWKLNPQIKYYFAIFIPSYLKGKNLLASFNDTIREKITQFNLPNLSEDRINGATLIYNYFSELFVKDTNRSISSFIAHYYIYNNPFRPTILIYPSLQSMHAKNNIVFHPNLVDENLNLSHIYKVKVEEISQNNTENSIKISLLDEFATTKNDIIIWTNKNLEPDVFKILRDNDFNS